MIDTGRQAPDFERILDDVRQVLKDCPGERFTKTKLREAVKGKNEQIDEAFQQLANPLVDGPRDPIFALNEGSRTLYTWEESIKPAEPLSV